MNLATDFRYALRAIRRHPGFSAIAISTLAFGVGANTAIFSVVDSILIRPLAYGDKSRLVTVHEIVPKFSQIAPRAPANAMHFLDWRNNVHAFERIAMIGNLTVNLTGTGEPERSPVRAFLRACFPCSEPKRNWAVPSSRTKISRGTIAWSF